MVLIKEKNGIYLLRVPTCPTINESLMPKHNRLVLTPKMRKWKSMIDLYILANKRELKMASQLIHSLIKKNAVFKADSYHVFHNSRVWTKKGTPKTIDANNRIKATLDAASKMMGVDDKYFFAGDSEKLSTSNPSHEQTIIVIRPMSPRTLSQFKEENDL